MSVNSEITRISGAKTSLKTKINALNDSQHQIANETLEDYSGFVDSIDTSVTDFYVKTTTITGTPATENITVTAPSGYTTCIGIFVSSTNQKTLKASSDKPKVVTTDTSIAKVKIVWQSAASSAGNYGTVTSIWV